MCGKIVPANRMRTSAIVRRRRELGVQNLVLDGCTGSHSVVGAGAGAGVVEIFGMRPGERGFAPT